MTEQYEHALATLKPDEREAIIGRVEMGYSYEELADALGKPSADAARKAAKRALVRLIRKMELPGSEQTRLTRSGPSAIRARDVLSRGSADRSQSWIPKHGTRRGIFVTDGALERQVIPDATAAVRPGYGDRQVASLR